MPASSASELLHKLLRNECTDEEKQQLFASVEQLNNDEELSALLEQAWNAYDQPSHNLADTTTAAILQTILQQGRVVPMPVVRNHFNWRRLAVAAAILLLVGLGSYFLFFNKKDIPAEIVKTVLPADIPAPQTNRASITLANGQTVYLDSTANGQLTMQGNVKLVKLADGQIAYQTANAAIVKEIQYNTLSNPRGSSVINMTLSDGSQVWLNAGSSITYPVAFMGNERKVQITGEAYFEVVHDAASPFKVHFNTPLEDGGGEVEVLGTHFNINAYDDEEIIRTTLLEGKVKVSTVANRQSSIIKPGQQAIIHHLPAGRQGSPLTSSDRVVRAGIDHSPLTIHDNVDLEAVMAWKNGLFSFDRADLQTVLRQLTRWYNVDAKYEGNIPQRTFGGDIGRDLTLSQVLKILEKNEVHFRIEGKTIVVMP